MYRNCALRVSRAPCESTRGRRVAGTEESIGMITQTNTSLLNGLKDPKDDRIWSEFYARYQPVLVAFGRKLGLTEQDAQDAAQETLLAFVNAYRDGGYDRDKGRLRTWLLGIASHKVRDIQRKHGRELVISDNSASTRFLNKVVDDEGISQVWEAQWQDEIVKRCMEEIRKQVKPTTLKAFELFALQGWPAEKVAAELGITENAVWISKNRVLTRLRKLQDYMEENW